MCQNNIGFVSFGWPKYYDILFVKNVREDLDQIFPHGTGTPYCYAATALHVCLFGGPLCRSDSKARCFSMSCNMSTNSPNGHAGRSYCAVSPDDVSPESLLRLAI